MSHPTLETNYKKTACILCSINCGLEIQTGGKDDRELIKIKGDRDNISSQGYLCNKASRLNQYQTGGDRISSPLRRRSDGTYESVDWDTAIREVAAGLKKVQQSYGGEKILFVGGGGQGNHLGALYSDGLLKTLGVRFRTNSLAQEKTGEFWVDEEMFGGGPSGDFKNADVSVFLGKNPWQSHGFPQARKVLKAIESDPDRLMIVIDPCVTDTALMADIHLQLKPGTDAWCLTALIAIIIQEGLEDTAFINARTEGFEIISAHFRAVNITVYAAICELDEALLHRTARVISKAKSTSVFEDLGVQQNIHSTLVSYLQKILWVITGNFAKKGAHNIPVTLLSLSDASKDDVSSDGSAKPKLVSPVLGSRVIVGMLPCNEVPDEILTDHPDRFRALIVESTNPVHAYAETNRMREAFRALEFSVVIDVAMTETAREADYVLPSSSIYEKYECVFFQVEFPKNFFQLRAPIVNPLPGTLAEPEIHTRLVQELGAVPAMQISMLRAAARINRRFFAAVFFVLVSIRPEVIKTAPALLYRSLGVTLENGSAAAAAPFWLLCQQFVRKQRNYAANAGFTGSLWQSAEKMFDALLNKKSGFIYTDSGDDYSDSWCRMNAKNKRIQLHLDELFPQITVLNIELLTLPQDFPLVLSAGQRRAETTNAIIRKPSPGMEKTASALRMHSTDAHHLELVSGDAVRIVTQTGSAQTHVEVTDSQRCGSIALPNGYGLDYTDLQGVHQRVGVALNELTSSSSKDSFAGTPWHKHVPARVEKIFDL